jgi:hypothetical protein
VRKGLAAVVALVAVGLLVNGGPRHVSAAPTTSPGTTSANATIYKVNPTTGSLSFAVSFGESLTSYTNNVATAESRGIDLGILGSLLGSTQCDGKPGPVPSQDQPQPVHVEARPDSPSSSDKGADPNGAPVFSKEASATTQPMADAISTTQSFNTPLVSIGSGRAETKTFFEGGVRTTIATVDIGNISLLGGLVSIGGLQWQLTQLGGAKTSVTPAWSIKSISVANMPLLSGATVTQLIPLINQLILGPLGMTIDLPTIGSGAGFQFITPFRIAVIPNATRDGLVGKLLQTLQPVRQPLFSALLQATCQAGNAITVYDIATGSVSGAGSLALELGGVETSSADITEYGNLGFPSTLSSGGVGGGALLPNAPSLTLSPGHPAVLGTPGSPATPGTPAAPAVATGTPALAASSPVRPAGILSKHAGPLAAISLAALGALALVAEADRRKMRKAQRTRPVEM